MKNLFALIFCLITITKIYAQSFGLDVIGSAGTFAESSSGSMSWTIGEVITNTYSSSSGFFTQGFHQPDNTRRISITNDPQQNIFVYPNPIIDKVTIDFSYTFGNHVLEIVDMQGQLLRKEAITEDQMQLTLSLLEFANGVYFLNIINKGSNTRNSFKIHKTE